MVTIWNEVSTAFEQTIKLVSDHADVIAQSTVILGTDQLSEYGFYIVTLEVSIPATGLHHLELYGDQELRISKPVLFEPSLSQAYLFIAPLQLTALFFAQAVVPTANAESIKFLQVMNYDGLKGKVGVSLVSIWDNGSKKDEVELSLRRPDGKLIAKKRLAIGNNLKLANSTILIVNYSSAQLSRAGNYLLKVNYSDKTRSFPLIIR